MRLVTSRVTLRRLVLSASVLIQQSRPFSFAWNSNSNSNTAMPSTHITERDGSGTITVSPRNEASQSGLVVICHGLGDTAEGFEDVAEQLAQQMPHLKFILPTAPTQPVTMNMGMAMPSWYDIVGLDERSNEHCKGIAESRARLEAILEKEHAATGLSYSRMVLAGFSQGGALSLFTGLQLDQKLAGIVVMSGYLPAAKQCQPKHLDVPIWHGHGTMDPMVQLVMAQKTKERLTSLGVKSYVLETFPIVHTVSPPELQQMMQFVSQILPPDESCNIQLKDPKEMSVKELKAAVRKAGLGAKAVGFMEKREFIKLLQDHRDGK
jgi:lysophospholipase-2